MMRKVNEIVRCCKSFFDYSRGFPSASNMHWM